MAILRTGDTDCHWLLLGISWIHITIAFLKGVCKRNKLQKQCTCNVHIKHLHTHTTKNIWTLIAHQAGLKTTKNWGSSGIGNSINWTLWHLPRVWSSVELVPVPADVKYFGFKVLCNFKNKQAHKIKHTSDHICSYCKAQAVPMV